MTRCDACCKELYNDTTVIEVACTYIYCMDCVRIITVAAKQALDAA